MSGEYSTENMHLQVAIFHHSEELIEKAVECMLQKSILSKIAKII